MFKKSLLLILLYISFLSADDDKYLSCTIIKSMRMEQGTKKLYTLSERQAKAINLHDIPIVVREASIRLGSDTDDELQLMHIPFLLHNGVYVKSDRIYDIYIVKSLYEIEFNTLNNDIMIFRRSSDDTIKVAEYYKCKSRSKTLKERMENLF